MTSNYPAILFCTVLDITHSPEKHDSLPMQQPRLGSDNVLFVLGVFERFSIGPSHHLTESHHVKIKQSIFMSRFKYRNCFFFKCCDDQRGEEA